MKLVSAPPFFRGVRNKGFQEEIIEVVHQSVVLLEETEGAWGSSRPKASKTTGYVLATHLLDSVGKPSESASGLAAQDIDLPPKKWTWK
jgi:hypothetical protein